MTWHRVGVMRLGDGRYFAIAIPEATLVRAGVINALSMPGQPVLMGGVSVKFEEIEPVFAQPASGEV